MDAIRRLLERNANAVERSRLEARRAKLAGGVALIKVGTSTETEMKEKRSRVDDALHASRAAVEEGIGAGGGVALPRPTKVTRLALRNAASIAGLVLTTDCLVAPVDAVTPDLTM